MYIRIATGFTNGHADNSTRRFPKVQRVAIGGTYGII